MSVNSVGSRAVAKSQAVSNEEGGAVEGSPFIHTVKSGETLSSLANRYFGTKSRDMVSFIADANGIENPDRILAGQKLLIPMTYTHVVKPGEDLWTIARDSYPGEAGQGSVAAYADSLALMNGLENPNDLKPGMLLAIPHV